ncbi:hypothetical protein BDK51DRAFT_49109 [Blyttiomyces helicus]|uniref:Uncharacterized protein n=1 Tax=Blyttiomyces helicus TaxID=388810 RepID=A0A4P9VTV1_9FUNG|nr:hypothetical protein BDK51DRAFT_49109 [Blyttiomyces helicus]|eukprot:RKO82964.1 hypothetical protein BDK51DRAFT_49109 [Blyttiomyces helicus]
MNRQSLELVFCGACSVTSIGIWRVPGSIGATELPSPLTYGKAQNLVINLFLMAMPVILADNPGHICLATILIIFVDGTFVSRVKKGGEGELNLDVGFPYRVKLAETEKKLNHKKLKAPTISRALKHRKELVPKVDPLPPTPVAATYDIGMYATSKNVTNACTDTSVAIRNAATMRVRRTMIRRTAHTVPTSMIVTPIINGTWFLKETFWKLSFKEI